MVSSTGVIEASASAMDLRWFGDASGHFMSMYRQAKSYQVSLETEPRMVLTGRPLSISKASPLRWAATSSDRKLSAAAAVRKTDFHRRPATNQVTR